MPPQGQPASTGGTSTGGKPFWKTIPRPVLLLMIGGVIGLGIVLYRRQMQQPTEPSETAGEAGVDPQLALEPSPVAYVSPNVPLPEPAETVGAVGQTALESLIGALVPLITKQDPTVQSLVELLSTRSPEVATAAPVVEAPPPPPPPPRPTGPSKPSHYNAGNRIAGIPIYSSKWKQAGYTSKTFPGASGWIYVRKDQDRGVAAYHVAYPNRKLELWHVDFLGAHRGNWVKHWTGRW